jgi:methyl-accepting chemotaxis protein
MNAHSAEFDIEGRTLSDHELELADGEAVRRSWLDRFSLVKKLYLAVFGNTLVLALVAMVMLAGTAYLGGLGQAQAIITSVEVRSNNAAIALVTTVDSLEAADTRDGVTSLTEARSSLALAYQTLTDPIEFAGEDMPADLGSSVHGFRDRVGALQTKLDEAGSNPELLAEARTEAKQLYSDVSVFAVDLHEIAAAKGDILFAQLSQFLLGFVIIVVAGVVVSLLAARQVISNIAGAIRQITEAMQRVAEGHIDTVVPARDRSDEIGAMARSLDIFRKDSITLRDLNGKRAKTAEEELKRQQGFADESRKLRAEKSDLLEGLADGFEVTVGEVIDAVSAASAQLRETSEGMVEMAEHSAEQSREASDAMELANRNVTAAAAATDEFALSISEISKQASDSAALARQSNSLVVAANAKMSELAGAADEIGEIAELIQTIAQRTNLLALNASIEAARGGEAGRGFAVVASEVKELAHQTSQATNSVTEKIVAMQTSTQASVVDLTSIVEQIEKLEHAAVVIATAVDQQSMSGEDLARNIDTVANGSSEVTEQIEALHTASLATGSASSQVLGSAKQLDDHAEVLRHKATQFLADIRSSSRDLSSDAA